MGAIGNSESAARDLKASVVTEPIANVPVNPSGSNSSALPLRPAHVSFRSVAGWFGSTFSGAIIENESGCDSRGGYCQTNQNLGR
jgi:hypothetical protein